MWLTRELKRTGNLPELRIRGGFYSSSPNLIAYLKREDSKIKRHGNFALVFEDYPIEGMYIVHGDEEGCRVYEASKADELFLQEDFRLVWPLYDKESLD